MRDAWLIDNDGNRVAALNTDIEFTGQIYGRTPQWGDGQLTHLLDMALMNFSHGLIRWRGPSAQIFETDSGNNDIWIDGGSVFGASVTDDGAQFTAGDEIAVWDQNGALHEATYNEIQSVTQTASPNGDGDEWRLRLDSWYSASPSAGQMVRLAPATQYSNTNILSNIARAWAYIADNTATPQLGNGDDADKYG